MPLFTPRFNQWTYSLVLLSLLWFILTAGNIESIIVGLPFILLAAFSIQRLSDNSKISINAQALLRFIPWFLWNSLRGGIDVAKRAISPTLQLNPGFVIYPLNIPAGSARIFMINCLSLLPGTLSAELNNNTLVLHALDVNMDVIGDTRDVERHVESLFNLAASTSDA